MSFSVEDYAGGDDHDGDDYFPLAERVSRRVPFLEECADAVVLGGEGRRRQVSPVQ